MKIYFAGSITGGRDDADLYLQIIEHLKKYGEVLTEHVGDKKITRLGENVLTDTYIHDRDIEWLLKSDVVVAEVTTASLGVGYEIGRAVENKKRVLSLYRRQEGKRLSAMIKGSSNITTKAYQNSDDVKKIIDEYFKKFVVRDKAMTLKKSNISL